VAVPRFEYELPPARRKGRFLWSVIVHAVAIVVLVNAAKWLPSAHITPRQSQVTLLYTPPPVTMPQPPKIIPPPPAVLARLTPPKIVVPHLETPKIEMPKFEDKTVKLPDPVVPKIAKIAPKRDVVTGAFASNTPVVNQVQPKREVVTDNFASGSSAPPTLQRPARAVQTGGFGDPNGVRGASEKKAVLTVASVGSFDLPAGQGQGNGTGGTRGARGTVASAGFGNGVAGNGQGDHQRSGTVAQAGFTQVAAAAPVPKARTEDKPAVTPVEILYKPRPAYTQEARSLHLQGVVLVRVTFGASGDLHVGEVVRGLGHGLDEAALRAAGQIRFRPAQRNGAAYETIALVHIVFELAE